MKEIWTLLKYHYKSLYGFHGFNYSWKYEREKLYLRLFIYGILLFLFYNIISGYIQINEFIYHNLSLTGEQNLMIKGLLNFTFILLLTLGLFSSYISLISSNKQYNYIMTFPLESWQILLSRFASGYIFQLAIALIALMPGLIINGVNSDKPFTYYIFALIITILIPMLPMALQFFVIILLQRIGYFFDKRGFANIMAFIINICFIILAKEITGMQNYLKSNTNTGINLIKQRVFQLEHISKIFYPVNIAYEAIAKKGLVSFEYMIIFIFISVAGLILILKLLSNNIVYIISRNNEVSGINKHKTFNIMDSFSKYQSKVIALLQRDMKLFYRDSTFIIYGLIMTLIIPLFLFYSFYSGMPDISLKIQNANKNLETKYLIIMFISLAYILLGGSNLIASTALSREGKTFYYIKSLPISPEEYIKAKLLHCNILSILFGVLTCIFSFFLTKLSVIYLLAAFIIGFLVLNIYFIIGILCEFCLPMLNWENPRIAMRQNVNVFISMLILIIFVIFMSNFIIKILRFVTNKYFMILIGLGILLFILYKLLLYFGSKRYYEIS